jgi:hypothetical protein
MFFFTPFRGWPDGNELVFAWRMVERFVAGEKLECFGRSRR